MNTRGLVIIDYEGYGFCLCYDLPEGPLPFVRAAANATVTSRGIIRHGIDQPRRYISGWDGRDLPPNPELERRLIDMTTSL